MDKVEYIWKWLKSHINNDYGVAGLMGNLRSESNFNSKNLQNSYESSLGYTDETYTRTIDNKQYSREQFIHDSAGYGLAQWTYSSRKAELYDYAAATNRSIGDLDMQLEFLLKEISTYKSVISTLYNATSVREASDAVMLNYERPANQTESNQIARASIGQKYYDQFAGRNGMRNLIIYKQLFYNSDCYKSGTLQTPSGVQVHSTGAPNSYLKRYVQPDDGRLGKNTNNNDHNHPGGNVCANAYIGRLDNGEVAVYQTLPWNMRCWLSGTGNNGNANKLGYLGFEICEDNLSSREYFDAVMNKAVLLTAYWCQEFGINVDEYVRDHHELHEMGLASGHADITHWLGRFGQTMNDFRASVKEALKDGIYVTIINCDEEQSVLFKARAVNPGTYLNVRSGKGINYSVVTRIPQGGICDILDNTDQEWWKVRFNDITGYCMSKYLEKEPEVFDENDNMPDDTEDSTDNNSGKIEIPEDLAIQLYDILKQQLNK